jgi:O-antigen/teichoic acid export membrane protein
MLVAAAQVVLSALGAVQTALLTRTLRFDQLTKTGVVSSILSGACGIAAALEGWGAWALGVQLLVMAAASTIALWWVSDWRPIFRFRFKSIRDLLSFGVHISMSSVLELVYSNGFILVIGKFYGARDVGYLTRATAIHTLPTGIISAIIGRTALPLFAARANDLEASLRAFRMSVRLAMLLSLPLMAGLAVLADLIILVLIGPKWLPAAPVLAIGAIGGALLPLHVLNLQLLLARGASKQFLKLELQKKACGLICFGIGCFYGIIGIAYASLVFQALAFYINSQPTKSDFAYGPVRQLVEVREPLLATAFMSAGVFALRQLVDLPPVPLLVSLVVSGGLLYLCFGFLLRMSSFKEGLELLTTVFAGERTTRALSYLRSRFIRTP